MLKFYEMKKEKDNLEELFVSYNQHQDYERVSNINFYFHHNNQCLWSGFIRIIQFTNRDHRYPRGIHTG